MLFPVEQPGEYKQKDIAATFCKGGLWSKYV